MAASGGESASFLDIPVGAGPAAMGSAYSALASNAYAPVWNPAGLGFLEAPEIAAQHLSYIESIHYEFLSGVLPLGENHGIGLSIQYLGTGDIPSTDASANSLGDYSSHFAAYGLSYGRTLTSRLSWGVAAKLIEAKISDVSAHAFAGDSGILYKASDRLTLAGHVANVGTEPQFLESKDPLPMNARLGAAYRWNRQVLFSTEGRWNRFGPASGHVGAQWDPIPQVGLRAGYKTDTTRELSAIAGLTTGAAVRLGPAELAYAWLPLGDLGDTHYFSLQAQFHRASNASKPRNLIHITPIPRIVTHPGRATPSYIDETDLLEQLLTDADVRGMAKR